MYHASCEYVYDVWIMTWYQSRREGRGGARWCGRTGRPPAGAAIWPGWAFFSTLR